MPKTNFYFDTTGIKPYLIYLEQMQKNMIAIIKKGENNANSVVDFNDDVIISSIDKLHEICDNLQKMTNIMEHMSIEANKRYKDFMEYNERI